MTSSTARLVQKPADRLERLRAFLRWGTPPMPEAVVHEMTQIRDETGLAVAAVDMENAADAARVGALRAERDRLVFEQGARTILAAQTVVVQAGDEAARRRPGSPWDGHRPAWMR